ncbi:hypothetical protein [Micromonospora avicenniae]|uniref:hypothetical protein n=1 Tax=Micromonospora avicenniae TaxID=1198245 RepID=UPI003334735C
MLNIVDDQPAPLRTWLPEMAAVLGGPAPKKAPAALARLAVGSWGVAFMNELRGAATTRARLHLDWRNDDPPGAGNAVTGLPVGQQPDHDSMPFRGAYCGSIRVWIEVL